MVEWSTRDERGDRWLVEQEAAGGREVRSCEEPCGDPLDGPGRRGRPAEGALSWEPGGRVLVGRPGGKVLEGSRNGAAASLSVPVRANQVSGLAGSWRLAGLRHRPELVLVAAVQQ